MSMEHNKNKSSLIAWIVSAVLFLMIVALGVCVFLLDNKVNDLKKNSVTKEYVNSEVTSLAEKSENADEQIIHDFAEILSDLKKSR